MSFLESIRSGHLREEIEKNFGLWGSFTYRFRWLIILTILPLLAVLFSQLKHVQFDTSMEGFFWDDDQTLIRYNEFREQYGREDKILIAVKTEEIFDFAFLKKLQDFHKQIEETVPYLEEVDSLVNARLTLGKEDELVVKDFLEDWPQTEQELQTLKELAINNPMYIGNYLSKQSNIAVLHIQNQVYMPEEDADNYMTGFDFEEGEESEFVSDDESEAQLLTGKANSEIRHAIDDLIQEFNSPDFQINVASGPYTTATFMDTTRRSMLKYTGYGVILIATLLALIFRRVVMVFLPITVSLLAMLASMSFMGILQIPLSFSMQIVPSFLLAVGVGNSVHVFTVFFQALDRGKTKEEALSYALQHSGLAIFMTGITTAGGLVSFLSSNMKPVAEFGAITPLGVLFALFFSLTLLPALIAIFPMRTKKQKIDQEKVTFTRRVLLACGDYSTENPYKVLAVWAIVLVTSVAFATQIKFSFYIYNQLPAEHKLIQALKVVDKEMSGAAPLEIIVDTGKTDGIKDPDFLKRVDQVYDMIEEFEHEGQKFNKMISVVDINKELHQALNENRPEYYAIPDDPLLISQELLLFENSGSDDLEKMVDSQFSQARLSFLTNSVDGIKFGPIMTEFKKEFDEIFGDKYEVTVTGLLDLTLNIFKELYYSMAKTYVVAFLIITPLMILLIGSLRVGLISMLPNLAPITVTLGVMGAFDIHLTTATLLTGSIAMGLVVDDTIHFMHNFQRYFARCGDVKMAVRQTLETAGQAITFTTLVLASAFMIFMLNEVIEWAYFGFVTGFCIVIALLADVFLAPALVTVLNQNRSPEEQTEACPA